MFYFSAMLAIVGAVGYQYFVKQIPATINPVVSVIGIYIAVLVFSLAMLMIFPAAGGLQLHIRQLSWVQIAIAASVFLIELGFLLMYRYGWNLSTANLITGIVINLALALIGIMLLGEKMSLINILGILVCITGVALMSYRP